MTKVLREGRRALLLEMGILKGRSPLQPTGQGTSTAPCLGPWGSLTQASSVPAPLPLSVPGLPLAWRSAILLSWLPAATTAASSPPPTSPCLNPSQPHAAPNRPWSPQQPALPRVMPVSRGSLCF